MQDGQIAGATLVISADGTQAVAEIGKVTAAAERMERTAVPAAGRAAGALGGVGAKAGEGAAAVEAASKRFVASVEREIASLTLSREEYRKWEAQAKGISESVYGPLVQRLEAARKAQNDLAASTAATSRGLNLVGVSAGQVSNAFRTLPAQITDVFTSLAGGQNPLLVLIQQGGQVRDSFGGIGNAIRAVGSVISPASVALGGLAAAAAATAVAFFKGAAEAAEFRRAVELSGNAAGVTLGQLRQQALAVSAAVGTQGQAAEVLAQLAGSGRVAAGSLALAAEAAVRLERVGGPAAEKTAQAFAELGKSPTEAALKLNESARFLTVSLLEQIRALEQQGNTAEAARVAQEAYANTVIQRTQTLEQNLGTLQTAWKGLGDFARGAWDAMLNVGREDTVEQRIASLQQRLQQNMARGFGERSLPGVGSPNDGLRSQIADLTETQRLARASANRQREAALLVEEYEKARKGVEKWADAALTSTERTNKALEEYRRNVAKVNAAQPGAISAEEIRRQEAAIRAQFATRTQQRDVYGDLVEKIKALSAATEQEAIQGTKATPVQRLRLDIYSRMSGEYAKLTAAQKVAIAGSLDELESREAVVLLAAREAKANEDAVQARLRYVSALDQANAQQDRTLDGLREQTAGLTGGKDALEQLRTAQLEAAAATAERAAITELERTGDEAAFEALKRKAQALRDEAALRRQIVTLNDNKAADEAADKAAKALADAYQREYDRITDGLTDALIRGGKSFVDYLRGLFRTLVLRPIIDPVVRTVAGALTGGASGAAFASTGSDALGLASAASKLGQLPTLLSNGFSAITGSLQTSVLRLGDFLATSQSGIANSLAGFLQTNYATLGSIGTALGAFGVGRAAGQLIGGGFGFGNSGNSTINAGGAVGAAVGSIVPGIGTAIGAAIGSALGGVVNRLFGRRLADSGIEGTLGAVSGFAGNAFQFFEGGLFRSDKTERTALDPQITAILSSGVQTLRDTSAAYAEALGLPVEGINGYTEAIRLSFKDLSQEQISALVEETVGQFGKNLIAPIASTLAPFTRAGEEASDTLQRLAESISGVNPVLRELGLSLLQVSTTGADAASQLLDAFGGAGNFASLTSSYYEKFFSETERAARATEILTEQFAAYGLALPKTREAFRALVEQQDLTTEGGRKGFAALLNVAGAFDQILTVTEGAKGGLDALSQALTGFTEALDETIDATRLRTLSPSARIAELRRREADLFARLPSASDPASVAERLQQTILDRIKEEASLSEALRREQANALQQQISALQRLRDIAGEIGKSVADLSFSDLSPLDFRSQLDIARQQFDSTVAAAGRGDLNAAANVSSALQAYIQEARQFFGSSADFAAIFADATGRASSLASQAGALDTAATEAQKQLDALQAVRDTSAEELAALLALRETLRERETASVKAASDQAALLTQQLAEQRATNEALSAQITQAAAIAEAQLLEARTLNEAVARMAGDTARAIDQGIEP